MKTVAYLITLRYRIFSTITNAHIAFETVDGEMDVDSDTEGLEIFRAIRDKVIKDLKIKDMGTQNVSVMFYKTF